MAAIKRADLDWNQGADFVQEVLWQAVTVETNSVVPPIDPSLLIPVDLTGGTATLEIRVRADDPAPLLTFTETNGIQLGGGTGIITLAWAASAGASLTPGPGAYVYQLDVVVNDGHPRRVLEGLLAFDRSAIH